MDKLKQVLQNNDLKATHQRLCILDTLEKKGHIDIDNLFELVSKQYPTISKATLYRNINELIDKNIVVEVKIPHQKNRYEIKKEPHIHLVCKYCGEVIDDIIDISSLINNIKQTKQFQVESSSILFEGVCKNCTNKGHL